MTKKTGLDLASLDTAVACDNAIDYELRHPVTDEPIGVFIKIIGKDSNKLRDAIRKRINARLRADAIRRNNKPEIRTAEQIEAESIDLLVLATEGWYCAESQNAIEYKGDFLTYNEENVRKVYTEQLWIRQQIDEACGDIDRFFKV